MAATHPATNGPATRPVAPTASSPSEGMPRGVWLLVGTIAAAKLATLGIVVWASRTPETGVLIGVTLPPWLLAAAVLLAGPVLFRLRLRRVRARRAQLRRAEWLLPEPVGEDLDRPRTRFRLPGCSPTRPRR